ncbi:MAG: flagellar protein FliS [Deltaproteobacteria bacterium]|nr:MAG: flagellar protein FliS [Deltaproteobacteria bacterium]
MYGRIAKQYKKIHVGSASPARVLDEVYGRLLRDLADARAAIEARDVLAKQRATDHALRILTELIAALEPDRAPELCANLERLYDFAHARIVAASRDMDAAPLGEAERIIETLRDAFRTAAEAA